MIKMLKTNGADIDGYNLVMDYLKQFNSKLVLNGYYPSEKSNNYNIEFELIHELKNEFDAVKYNKLCKNIIENAHKSGYYKHDNIKKLDLDCDDFKNDKCDWRNFENWKWNEFNKRNAFMKDFKFKTVLCNVCDLGEDGPAADPVIAFWHWFPNQHKLVYGQMLKYYDGIEQDKKLKLKKLKQVLPNVFSLRTMIVNNDYRNILKNISGCVSRGDMVQIQLINKPQTNEDLDLIAEKWRFMFQKFLHFRNVT